MFPLSFMVERGWELEGEKLQERVQLSCARTSMRVRKREFVREGFPLTFMLGVVERG